MTGPKGNSEFCFPKISMFPRDDVEGNIEIREKAKFTVALEGPVH